MPALGRSLKESESVLLRNLTTLLSSDSSICPVTLVGHEYFGYILVGMLIYLFEPVLNVVERPLVRAVIDEYDTHSSLIVCLRDSPEPFLSSGVPYLQLYSLIVNINLLDLEVNAYSIIVSLRGCLPMVAM